MKSISEIKREFEQTGELELPALFAQYESDARNGVTARWLEVFKFALLLWTLSQLCNGLCVSTIDTSLVNGALT